MFNVFKGSIVGYYMDCIHKAEGGLLAFKRKLTPVVVLAVSNDVYIK